MNVRKTHILITLCFIFFISILPQTGSAGDDENSASEIRDCLETGKILMSEQKYEEALEYFKKAEIANPKSAEVQYYLGVTYYWLEDYRNADAAMTNALNLDNSNYLIWYYKGKIINALNSRLEALGCFEKAIELKPDFTPAWLSKGILLYASKNYNGCIASMMRVTSLDKNEARAWIFMGMSYYMLADFQKAQVYISRGLTIDPSLEENVPEQMRKDLGFFSGED